MTATRLIGLDAVALRITRIQSVSRRIHGSEPRLHWIAHYAQHDALKTTERIDASNQEMASTMVWSYRRRGYINALCLEEDSKANAFTVVPFQYLQSQHIPSVLLHPWLCGVSSFFADSQSLPFTTEERTSKYRSPRFVANTRAIICVKCRNNKSFKQ